MLGNGILRERRWGLLKRYLTCGFLLSLFIVAAQDAGAHLVKCSGSGQVCNESFGGIIPVAQAARFWLTVGAPDRQCSSVSYTLLFQDRFVGKTGFLKAGARHRFELGVVMPGDYSYEVRAEGKKGRCNTGTLKSWAADHWLDWELISTE